MIRRPPRSTRTEHTLSLHDALPSSLELAHRQGIEELVGDEQQRRLGDLSDVVEPVGGEVVAERRALALAQRSEEHTSELQSLMRISYAVFCLKKKTPRHHTDIFDH